MVTVEETKGGPAMAGLEHDELDSVLHLDEDWYQEGLRDGREAGLRRLREEGHAVG